MNTKNISRHKRRITLAAILLMVLVGLVGGFLWYASDYYPAQDVALAVLAQDGDSITVQDNLTILSTQAPSDTALIFYPGAKVEATAYLPLLDQIRQLGVTCILVDMPFRMAIFAPNAAQGVMEQFPDIQHWYLAGHSMGGAMASQFAADHPDQVEGLILLGAYLYGDYPPADTLENVVEIPGGNHAQFGNYGPQKGDPPASITAAEHLVFAGPKNLRP